MNKNFQYKELARRLGSGESTVVTLVTDMREGTSEICIEHQIRERFPTSKLDEAMRLYEDLGKGNGRVSPTLRALTK